MKESTAYRKSGRNISERGSAIVESVICMLVLCLVLFGLLQIFMLAVAQEITDYTAFSTARSMSVGFNNKIVDNEAFLRSVPASGAMVTPSGIYDSNGDDEYGNSVWERYAREHRMLEHFAAQEYKVDYEYWHSGNNATATCLEVEKKRTSSSVTALVTFVKYPMNLPFAGAFFSDPTANVKSECSLGNNASTYLVQ